MRCETCSAELERPGDFCLRCRNANCDAVVLSVARTEATLTFFLGTDRQGQTVIPTKTESGGRAEEIQQRNYLSRVGDEIHRKRPDAVYVTGDGALIRRLRRYITAEWYRIDADDPIEAYRETVGEPSLEIIDIPPVEKLGGSHSTVIGGRRGRSVLRVIGEHPHVKKIIPGPIDASGVGSQQGFRAKATRATGRGNIRILLRDGSSVQEIRIVTTASSRENGERISAQVNERLAESGYQAHES